MRKEDKGGGGRIGVPVLSMLYFQVFAWSQSPSLCGLFNLKGWSNSASHSELHKFISKLSFRSRVGYWTISHVGNTEDVPPACQFGSCQPWWCQLSATIWSQFSNQLPQCKWGVQIVCSECAATEL